MAGTGTGFSFSTAVPNYLPFMDHNLQFSELHNSSFNSQTIDVIADNFFSPYHTTSHNKREATEISQSHTSSTPQATAKYSARKGKRVKANENEEEEPKEVIHVRARRGQATDSHSLAERVRRGKINERLRFLQDIVPGCYKSMGMAIMLDEIINYIQSLQNQVEFLSMKLTAASSFFDFSYEIDATETIQTFEDQELERLIRDRYGGASSIWPQ